MATWKSRALGAEERLKDLEKEDGVPAKLKVQLAKAESDLDPYK